MENHDNLIFVAFKKKSSPVSQKIKDIRTNTSRGKLRTKSKELPRSQNQRRDLVFKQEHPAIYS